MKIFLSFLMAIMAVAAFIFLFALFNFNLALALWLGMLAICWGAYVTRLLARIERNTRPVKARHESASEREWSQ